LQFVHTKQFKKRRNNALLFRQGAVANFVLILSNIVLLDAQLYEWKVGPRMNVGYGMNGWMIPCATPLHG
jgi:hypothetical protein